MQPWRARDGHVREAVARQVRAVVVGPAVALRAAEAATDAPRREAAEPLTRGEAALGTACSLLAGLAGEACARADRADSDARVARPASAADAALDRAQRDARPRQEEACAQRAHSEELEELASGRLAGELAGCGRRQVHLVREARDRRLRRRTQAWLVAGVQPRRAGDREIGEAVARAASAPCALALGAAEATAGSSARQAAEPLARGRATLGTAASLLAGLAGEADVLAGRPRRRAGVARAAPAADAAFDGAERNARSREEQARSERRCSEHLEELPAG